MRITAIAAMAATGLLAAACQPTTPATPVEPTPVAEQPTEPAAPDPFQFAVNYECEGGGVVDVEYGGQSTVMARIDGGAAQSLTVNPDSQTAMEYKNAETTLTTDGGSVTWKSGAVTKTCMIKTRELPAPTVAGAVRALTEADAGASVEIKVGEKVTIALVGVPTAGYVWEASKPPAFVKATQGPGGATSTAQFTPGFAGGSHWEVTVIEAVSAGEGEITLAQIRPWDPTIEPDTKTFKFKLKVS